MVSVAFLERGQEAYRQRAWRDAFEALTAADGAEPLAPVDLERLAASAYLTGRDEDHARFLERAHQAYRAAGDTGAAARSAFWIGFLLVFRGEMARATGWLSRAQRFVGDRDCVERGYLLLPAAARHLDAREHQQAIAIAGESAAIGERFGDADLVAAARHVQGQALVGDGRMEDGLRLLDEVMVAVTSGELSPIMTGLVYCSVIDTCQRCYAFGRAHEWTSALARWCDAQPGLVAFTATCLVRRAEIMQLHGEWPEALREVGRARERVAQVPDRNPPAAAFYQQGEIHRLRGEFARAEAAYREASRCGADPQPGLALLRLAQGRTDAAVAAIRRAAATPAGPLARSRLLPAVIEIMLAASDVEAAQAAAAELEEIAAAFDTTALAALAAHGRGQVQLAEGDARAALVSLRRAWQVWQEIDAPYLAARARILVALACRAVGDDDGCTLELEAARTVLRQLGAAPDVIRLDTLAREAARLPAHGLSPRELQVLQLVATGKSNRGIAAELAISEKTVARHVSNIFTKLGVSSRSAATAYAYEHALV